MELPTVNLKAIILVHWLLTTWGCMAAGLPASYAWGNYTILAVGVWAVAQRDSVDAIIMFLIGMLVTILTDIIHIAIWYPITEEMFEKSQMKDTFRFSAGMAILSLLLKPVSCFCAYQMYRERGGEYNINFGFPTVTSNRSSYQSIDQQDAPAGPHPYSEQDGKAAPHMY